LANGAAFEKENINGYTVFILGGSFMKKKEEQQN
jgi:hypothetical protein